MVFFPGTFLAEYRVARKFPITSSDGWWVNRWPLLGWLETLLKIAAFVAAAYVPLPNPPLYTPPRSSLERASFYCETFLMFGAAVLLSLAIFDRLFLYREVISMIFVFPNMWAHWNVFLAMYQFGRSGISARYFRIFCFLMLAGDVVKLVFFAVHDFSMLNIARYILYTLVFCFSTLYTLVLVLDYGYLTPLTTEIVSLVQMCLPSTVKLRQS